MRWKAGEVEEKQKWEHCSSAALFAETCSLPFLRPEPVLHRFDARGWDDYNSQAGAALAGSERGPKLTPRRARPLARRAVHQLHLAVRCVSLFPLLYTRLPSSRVQKEEEAIFPTREQNFAYAMRKKKLRQQISRPKV